MSETFGDAYRKLNEIKKQLTSKGFAKFKGIGGWYPISTLDQPERDASYRITSDLLIITRANGLILEFEIK